MSDSIAPSAGAAPAAKVGIDPAAAKDQAQAGQLLVACNAAIRVLRIHSDMNEAVTKPMESLQKLLEGLSERHPRIILAVVEGVFYLDTTRIRLSSAQLPVAQQLAEEFAGRSIGGLTFEGVIPIDELVTFFRVLDSQRTQTDFEALRRALVTAGVKGAGLQKVLRPITESDAKKSANDQAADVYVAAIRHVTQAIGTKANAASPRGKRIIHELVDLADKDPVTLLALAGLRDTGSEESEHSVAVGALSIALGRRIGLDRNLLADLGIAALHHDMGLDALGSEASRDVERHPLVALKSILRFAPTEALFRQVLAAFEHHRDYDGGGHPSVQGLGKPHLFSQIIRVTNDFDGLTRGRREREPLDVPEALAIMQRGAGRAYSGKLLEVFMDLVGGVDGEGATSEPAPAISEMDLLLAEFLGKSVEEPPPPPAKEVSDVDLMLAEFLGKPVEATVAPAKEVSDVDLMLAEFLGKTDEVAKPPPAPKPIVKAAPAAPTGPKKNALGAMKLKKVPRKKKAD